MIIKIAPFISTIVYLFLILISFYSINGRQFPLWELTFSDVVLLILAVILSPLIFRYRLGGNPADKSANLLYLIFIYAFISMLWVQGIYSYSHMMYQIILAVLTVLIPHLSSKIIYDDNVSYRKWISNISLILTAAFLMYIFWVPEGQRLAGPLGTSAILSVIIIPVIAVHLYNFMDKYRLVISGISLLICFYA